MSNSFAALCDDFYINMRLGTQMKLATDRATVVSFFERIQRLYPGMVNFHQDQRSGESSIEESRKGNSYRWLSMESQRLSSGYLNPPAEKDAYEYNRNVLETVPFYLAVSGIDLDYVDVLWGFDFDFKGNHHELIAETLLGDSPLGKLLETSGAKALNYEISGTVSLSEDTRTHGRVWIEPRTTGAQVRTGEFAEEALSLYVIVRQWAGGKKLPELHEVYGHLAELGEKFISEHVVEQFVSAIRQGIARRG